MIANLSKGSVLGDEILLNTDNQKINTARVIKAA